MYAVSRDRQFWVRVAVLVLAVALTAVLVGALTPASQTAPPEGLGAVDGVAYNESLSVTVEDGLNESELDTVAARSMARIEVVRGLAFKKPVDVEVISREEYRQRRTSERSEAERTWTNVRWETLFTVGEDRNAAAILDEAFAGGVQGYYSLRDERIIIVSDADQPVVDTETLVHELVHALQDQRFGLEYDSVTIDARQAYESVVEGEAELLPERYFDRCDDDWSCLRIDDEVDETDLEPGIRLQILAPYVQGREFVDTVRERGGWEAVDDLHDRPPESSTQVIHPDSYPDATPANVTVTDRSTADWQRFAGALDTSSTDTLGETGIYAMLFQNDVLDVDDPLAYEHTFSTGWAGDQLVPYERDGELGYVWEVAWETTDDARQFVSAYRTLLEERGAVGTGDDVFVIPDGPFEDAFRLTREGTTVRIVNAPTSDALDGIHG